MKLRRRKAKRIVICIEREKALGNSKVASNDVTVKEEAKQVDMYESDPEYRFYCRVCSKREKDFSSILEHRKSEHNIEYNNISIKHVDLVPDMDEPKNYCHACEVEFSSRGRYRIHLATIHHLLLRSRNNEPVESLVPDPNYPNPYCRICDKFFTDIAAYRRHLNKFHLMNLPRVNPLPPSDTRVYCASCDCYYSSEQSYRVHFARAHTSFRPKTKTNKKELPDLNDPNLYCKTCKVAYANEYGFKQHCRNIHDIKVKNSAHNAPDPFDPKNYCRACNKTLNSKIAYRKHIFTIHNMNFATMIKNTSSSTTTTPDVKEENYTFPPRIDDPDNFCRVCKRKYTTNKSYRHHLSTAHKISLKPLTIDGPDGAPALETIHIVNPDAVIDVNSPDCYCAQCDYYFSFRNGFMAHLQSIHNID